MIRSAFVLLAILVAVAPASAHYGGLQGSGRGFGHVFPTYQSRAFTFAAPYCAPQAQVCLPQVQVQYQAQYAAPVYQVQAPAPVYQVQAPAPVYQAPVYQAPLLLAAPVYQAPLLLAAPVAYCQPTASYGCGVGVVYGRGFGFGRHR